MKLQEQQASSANSDDDDSMKVGDEDQKVDRPANVEYVSEQLDLQDAGLEAFSDVFARFQLPADESAVSTRLRLLYTAVINGLLS